MQDRSVPYYPLVMIRKDPFPFPQFHLPEGYQFQFYRPGLETEWCRIVLEVGPIDDLEEVQNIFQQEFAPFPDLLEKRCLFVTDPDGSCVATACLWFGSQLGSPSQRIHWVMVSQNAQGRGLAKAMLSRLFSLYQELHLQGGIYLTSETWSYKAVNIYQRFGMTPYLGPLYTGNNPEDAHPQMHAREAWNIVADKLSHYPR